MRIQDNHLASLVHIYVLLFVGPFVQKNSLEFCNKQCRNNKVIFYFIIFTETFLELNDTGWIMARSRSAIRNKED